MSRLVLWIASVAAIVLLVRSWFIEPVPFGIAIGALSAYLVLALCGVLVPQLEMFGDVLWRGPRGGNRVALTFDDGPHPATTQQVLDILEAAKVRATFFVVGWKVERHPEIVRAMIERGHEVGVHGYQHDRLYAFKSPRDVERDIELACAAVERAAGARPVWFRPPVGFVTPRTAAGARRAKMEIVGWSVRALDGVAGAHPDRVVRRVEKHLSDGSIVLLHDASEREDFVPASIDALPRILSAISRAGLRTVTIRELFE